MFKRILWLIFVLLIGYGASVLVRAVHMLEFRNARILSENIEDPDRFYYFTFDHSPKKESVFLDSNNVFVKDYSKAAMLGVRSAKFHNPITITHQTMRTWQRYLQNQQADQFNIFISNANWLVQEQTEKGAWLEHHTVKKGRGRTPEIWYSAYAQGLGMSVLTRAFIATGDSTYLFTAIAAAPPLAVRVEDGGVLMDRNGSYSFEEYPMGKHSPGVLNGHIYALLGLYDVANYTEDPLIDSLITIGEQFVRKNMDFYNADYWSYYCSLEDRKLSNHYHLCSPWYQNLHVVQFNALNAITGNLEYKEMADNFEEQFNSPIRFGFNVAYVAYTDIVVLIRKSGY